MTDTALQVRKASEGDLPAIANMADLYFKNAERGFGVPIDPDYWLRTLSGWVAAGVAAAFFATDASRIVGIHIAQIGPIPFAPLSVTAFVMTMWIDPEYRGRGLASSLLAMSQAWASAAGARRLLCGIPLDYSAKNEMGDVGACTPVATKFYESQGFRSVEMYLAKEIG